MHVDNTILVANRTDSPVTIRRNHHFACIRLVQLCNQVHRVYDNQLEDYQYQTFSTVQAKEDPLSQIIVDPDNQLTPQQRQEFRNICLQFSDVLSSHPGKYNGAYGFSNNSINFTSRPPPNKKVYVPNYSPDMQQLLAQKMDKLISWGILQRPEQVGVTVEFLSPSMLVPKVEPNQYRLVTDFSSLNSYIRKFPTHSPGIREAKQHLAEKQFRIELDFSEYFYQGGLQREDSQWLGVIAIVYTYVN